LGGTETESERDPGRVGNRVRIEEGLRTSGILCEDVVEDSVRCEFPHISRQALCVQRLQLCLTLVKFLMVALRQTERLIIRFKHPEERDRAALCPPRQL